MTMKRLTKKHLIGIAKLEMAEWKSSLTPGLVMAILFAFIHRVTEGETIEETFFKTPDPEPDYEI